jgi:hypothetical protein
MLLIKIRCFNNSLLPFHLRMISSEMPLTVRVRKTLIYSCSASLRRNPFLKLTREYSLYAANLSVHSINVSQNLPPITCRITSHLKHALSIDVPPLKKIDQSQSSALSAKASISGVNVYILKSTWMRFGEF